MALFNKQSKAPKPAPYERHLLLIPLERLGQIPEFNISNATTNPTLVCAFCEVAVLLTEELPLPETNFTYYRDNLVHNDFREVVSDQQALIEYLRWKMMQPRPNHSRYRLGFRSIFFILMTNIDSIDTEYICKVRNRLTPFYEVYAYPHHLVPGSQFQGG